MPGFQLNYSDPRKSSTITVLGTDAGPGVNNQDTSLSLVGPGYTNYGLPTAQNFLKLLESFSSLHPPENAIEGQLWYDTSNPQRKVLRINNGSGTSTRWPSVSGIWHQPSDPSATYSQSVNEGDLWVDTDENLLKIRTGQSWLTVGPSIITGNQKTGSEIKFLQSNTGETFPVLLNWANNKVVSIIAYNQFTPRFTIEGFSTIKPGINLTLKNNALYNGTAEKALALEIASGLTIRGRDLLRNQAISQTHTGTFIVEDSTGFLVKNKFYPTENVRVTNASNFSQIVSDNQGKPFKISSLTPIRETFIQIDPRYNNIGVNIAPGPTSETLVVNGSGKFINTLTIASTSTLALIVEGGMSLGDDALVNGSLTVVGNIASSGNLTLGISGGTGSLILPASNDTYDLGSQTYAFRKIFTSQIGSTLTNVNIYGTLYGNAAKLANASLFKMEGVVTTTLISLFDGSQNIIFTTTAHRSLIESNAETTSIDDALTFLVLNTGTGATTSELEKINRKHLFADITPNLTPLGSILAYSTSTGIPSGWLICNGAAVDQTTYPELFSLIGYSYGDPGVGQFNLPDLTTSTIIGAGVYLSYIIRAA